MAIEQDDSLKELNFLDLNEEDFVEPDSLPTEDVLEIQQETWEATRLYPEKKLEVSSNCAKFDSKKKEYLWRLIENSLPDLMRKAGVKNAEEMHQFILKGHTRVQAKQGALRWSYFLRLIAFASFPEIKQNRHFIFRTLLEEVIIPFSKFKTEKQAVAEFDEERIAALEGRVAEEYIPRQQKFLKANKELFEKKLKN